MTLDLWGLGIAAFMLGVTLAFVSTLILNVGYAFVSFVGRAFWGDAR